MSGDILMRSSPIKANSPERYCPRCKQTISIDGFKKRSTGSYKAYCIDCEREISREQYRRTLPKKKSKGHSPKDAIRAHARNLLQSAVRWGKVIRDVCAKCGNAKVEGHHEDYEKPYEVIWLCKVHHGQAHWKPRALKPRP
jgi:hypothetical protein